MQRRMGRASAELTAALVVPARQDDVILKALTILETNWPGIQQLCWSTCRAEEDLLAKGAVTLSSALPVIQQNGLWCNRLQKQNRELVYYFADRLSRVFSADLDEDDAIRSCV